jgi:hypothetical protein
VGVPAGADGTDDPGALKAAPADALSPSPGAPTAAQAADVVQWALTRPAKLRAQGAERARVCGVVAHLVASGQPLNQALTEAAAAAGVPRGTLVRWHYRVAGWPPEAWAARLTPGWCGRSVGGIEPQAWDFFTSYYLTRKQPTLAEAYRRTCEAAAAHRWGKLPSLSTFERQLRRDFKPEWIAFRREGIEALKRLFPKARVDRTLVRAGEVVSGDGLKFDRLWVAFPDGEVLNTATGWFWQDYRTARILAWRLGKTENLDVFRLSTYDLLSICVPEQVILDNTMVAGAAAMSGQSGVRNRGGNRPEEPIGLITMLLGPTALHFTDPSEQSGNPGAKPIERAFGIGGLHHAVATHPKFVDRGYSKATAIPFAEFEAVVREEVARHNARPGRRSAVCRGQLSFDQAWAEDYGKHGPVKTLPEAQRAMLLLMPEAVRLHRENGEVALKAGHGPWGKPRYWCAALTEHRGQLVTVYYDPADHKQPVSVFTMAGQFIATAPHLPDSPGLSNEHAREQKKFMRRYVKQAKQMADTATRLDALQMAAMYPAAGGVTPPAEPDPKVVRADFGGSRLRADGGVVKATGTEGRGAGKSAEDRYVDAANRVVMSLIPRHARRTEE